MNSIFINYDKDFHVFLKRIYQKLSIQQPSAIHGQLQRFHLSMTSCLHSKDDQRTDFGHRQRPSHFVG
jgi:hypothetical protein